MLQIFLKIHKQSSTSTIYAYIHLCGESRSCVLCADVTVQEISPHPRNRFQQDRLCQDSTQSADPCLDVRYVTLSPCHLADDGTLLQEPRCPRSPTGSPCPAQPPARPRPCPLDQPPGERLAPGHPLPPPPPATQHPWPMEASMGTVGTAGMGTTGRRHRAQLAVTNQ